MKQNYFFSLVCLCFLLASQISLGQSTYKTDLPHSSTRSSGDSGNKVKSANLLSYLETECDNSDDFLTMSEDVYDDGLTTPNGWYASYAERYEDFLSLFGVLKSPVLSNGCNSISFKYAKDDYYEFGYPSFRIEIQKEIDGVWSTAWTETISNPDAEELVFNEVFYDNLKIEGTVQLVITRLSPNNISGTPPDGDVPDIKDFCLTDYIRDLVPPTAPTELAAQPNLTSVALSWEASTDNISVEGYRVSLDGTIIDTVTTTSYVVNGLIPSTEYTFDVEALDGDRNNSEKASVSATTLADNIAPSVPQNLTGISKESGMILSWTASTDNVGVTNYNVYADGNLAGSTSQTTDTITGLAENTQYLFEVEAEDISGNKSDKVAETLSTIIDTEAPTIPGNLQANTNENEIILSWTASTDNTGVTKYNIYLGGELTGSTTELKDTIKGLAPNTEYQFEVEAEDATGNKSAKASVTASTPVDNTAPDSPENLVAEATENGVELLWTASTDNFGVTKYNVYVNGEFLNSTVNVTDTIKGLEAGIEYLIEVDAEDASGNKSGKTPVTLSGESTAGLAFSFKDNLIVNRTRDASDFRVTKKFTDLFNYPDGYNIKTEISKSSDVAITYNSTNENHLLFDGYYYSSSSGQYFYYKIPTGAYGTDTLTISIDYHGFTSKALVIANLAPLSARDDSYTIDIGGTLGMNVAGNDIPSSYLDKTSLEILQNTSYGALTNNIDGTLTYVNESATPNYSFENFEYRIADVEGHYDTATVKINIHMNSYASRVIEFMPAPGQFTNESIGQSNSAEKTLGTQGGMISLGAFGGYVVYGFDQPIINNPQNPYGVDFSVKGNSFAANLYGVWTEPAAVRVMKDLNGDGVPNDGEWYELAGSDYYMSGTQKNVKMTYYNPHYNERYTVPWKKDNGETGAMLSNSFHSHPYYPDPFDFGCNKDSMTYEGNIIKSSLDMSTPSYIEFYRAPFFGYCDSRGNSADLTDPQNPYFKDEKGNAADGFDISWAVDRDGNHKELDQIDFVKIYTGGFANAGWLGEWSSEVLGVGITTPDPDYVAQDYYLNYIGITQLKVLKGHTCQFEGFLFKNGRPQTDGVQQWSSSNPEVGTVDNTGLFTAVADGETWLRFSQKSDIPTDSIRLLVVELEGVHLEMEGNSAASSDSTSLIVGESISITAQGLDNIGDVLNGSTSNRFVYDTYTWTTSNPEIGTIDNGLFTGKKVGRTMVHAYSDANPELSDSILVIVNETPKLSPVNNPVVISYYNPVGEKTSSELFATGTNSVTYLNSVVSKTGLSSPVIEKNVLKCNFTAGVYGTDTLTFNLTSYKQDTTISVAFIYKPDGYEKDAQILFVNNARAQNPDKASLNAYTPDLDSVNVIDGQLDAYSVKDVLVDGAFAFVLGENFLSKYNLTTYEKENTIGIDETGNSAMAMYNNLLLVTEQSNLAIYYKTDLTLSRKIALSGKIHSVKVVGSKAFVFLSGETTSVLNKVVVVDLIEGKAESEYTLAEAGLIVSETLVKGTKLYITGTTSGSGKTAVMEYDTENNMYSVSEANNNFSNTLNANAVVKGDSILLTNGEGYVAYTISTKTFGTDVLMKTADDFYPTAIAYHASLSKYFVSYSNAAKTESKGLAFDLNFAEVAGFDSVETAPALIKCVEALEANEKPSPNLTYSMSNFTAYEKATSNTSVIIYKNRFTDGEDNFEIYPRYLEHTSWLTWNTGYTTSGNKQLYAYYSNTIDKDSVITIPVDAIDNYGFSVTRTFDITIKPRVYKPVVKNPIADTIVAVNSADIQIPLVNVFTNTSSSGVTFGKTVSGNTNSGLITTTIVNDTLTLSIAPNKAGEVFITVKDSAKHNTYGVKYVETSFKVTVVDDELPSVPADFAGSPSETSISLSWTASTDNVGVTGYNIYKDGVFKTSVVGTNYLADKLNPGTEYTFEVEAFDAEGNRSEKALLVILTTDDETPPSMPENLTAIPSETSIELSWTASIDNVGVTGYVIYLDGDSINMVTETVFNATELNALTEYVFEVEAFDASGNKSGKASVTVSTTDETAPSAPSDLAAVTTETSVSFSWTASTDNVGVAGYVVYLDGDSINTVTETVFNATELNALTEYVFEVEAFDASGNKSEKVLLVVSTIDETVPSVPSDLAATATETSIRFSWTASTDNVGVAGYIIYLDGDSIDMVTETTFIVTGLDVISEYTFEVQAFDEAGNESEKALLTVSTTDETAPSVPSGLSAVASDTSAVLSWIASADNVGVTGYIVYLNGDSIATVIDTTFTVVNLEADTEYTFEVEAFDEAGNKSERAIVVQRTIITGIESWEVSKLKVYPNPFVDYFIVDAKNTGYAVVYSLSGKAMFNVLLQTGSNRIDASGLPGGIYLLKQETNTVKLIKR
ncbi:T9SS type A sorting domain-containing protein [Maribellus comscasis]|uniref:T9SS type A sorting domain-containing protein n=1 Tax=Maribellus comscasis TaxID=2681766 RepID=A0A6I6JY76_9BACT|nr:fibronectin type III domain-containing protein [Maribellus comscasis]QGY46289.1 T9SS type A sorting domain-containing protein [Maribellus comscasis]